MEPQLGSQESLWLFLCLGWIDSLAKNPKDLSWVSYTPIPSAASHLARQFCQEFEIQNEPEELISAYAEQEPDY